MDNAGNKQASYMILRNEIVAGAAALSGGARQSPDSGNCAIAHALSE
ncbi:hypothetical protein [Pseudomonas sp. HS6]|nr:hypothetical protein [Pseudomonas sp. HS6]UQS13562.1 hypothetical protein JJN09_20365 [Pseudomonas sp. HS6]